MKPRRDLFFWLLVGAALLSAGNAIWMLGWPEHWYHELPADVPDTGPFNAHFVRDIGCAFATMTLAFAWAAWQPRWRAPLVVVATFFLAAHALLHVYDTARGALHAHHWLLEAPSVYAPVLLLIPFAIRALREADAPT